jgi:O-antigen/teichoic acid export membrane protein
MELLRTRLRGDRLGGRVARGALRTILVAASGAAVSFLVQLGLARTLGRDSYGVYLLTLGWLALAQLGGKLELDTTSVRFVGGYVATQRWGLLRGYLSTSRRAVLTASTAVAAIGAIVVLAIPDQLDSKHPEYATALLVACALLPALTMLLLDGAVLQGFQQYARAQLPFNLLRPLAFGLTVAAIVAWRPNALSAPVAVGANFVGVLLALALVMSWRARATPREVREATPEHDRPTWARTAYPLFAVSLAQVIISQQADVLVVGTYLDTAQAAVYGAASQLTLPLSLAAASVTFVAQPLIADLYARHEPQRLQSLIRIATWGSAALGVPIALALIAGGPWLLRLYGEGFDSGHTVLVLLALAQLVVGMVGSLAGYMLTMTAHEREAAWIIGLSALLNILLALVLTPIYGPIGTASATLTAALVRAAALSLFIRWSMGLRLPAF